MKYRIVKEKHFYMEYAYFIEKYIEPYFFGLFGGYWKRLAELSVSFDGLGQDEEDIVFSTEEKAMEYLTWLKSRKELIKE